MSSDNSTSCIAILLMISVQTVFSGYQIVSKGVLNSGVSPISFALYRELGATIVLVAIALCREKRDAWPQWEHRWGFLNVGACMFCNVFGMLAGLSLTTPATVAVLQPTQPVFTCLLAWWAGQEQMSVAKSVGILLSCFGSALVSISTKGAGHGVDFGSLLVVLQCIAGSNMIVQQRPLMELGYSPLILTTSIYAVATAITLVFGAGMAALGLAGMDCHIVWWHTSTAFIVAVVYSILLGTVYNYVAIAWSRQYLNATTITLFGLLQAIMTPAVGRIVYGDNIYPGQVIGAGLIVCGLAAVALLGPTAQSCGGGKETDSDDAKETTGSGSETTDSDDETTLSLKPRSACLIA